MAGEYGAFDPSTYTFSNEDLNKIITKTQNAIDEMNTVNNLVTHHTDLLTDANRSDSGTILSSHLATWTTDFNNVVNNLNDLNGKANALLQVNLNTHHSTRDAAK
jgi:hypothetical protein